MKHRFSLLFVLAALCLVPSLAQEEYRDPNTVMFNYFFFEYDPLLAAGVNIYQFPGDPVEESYPGGPQPPYTSFRLYQAPPVPEYAQASAGEVRLYIAPDLPDYDFHKQRYDALNTLLKDHPDLDGYMQVPGDMTLMVELPFMPVYPAAQVIRARAHYIETAHQVRGISYITVFQQGISPFLSGDFLFTFQGMSPDGSRYVSLVAPVSTALFPSELPADLDYDAFSARLMDYFAASVTILNHAAPDDFTPSLNTLDDIVRSMIFSIKN